MNKEYVICEKTELVAVADAIREKTGSTDDLTVSGLADAVSGIEAGGGVTVPELITVTFETVIPANSWTQTIYPINISYLTIDENNTLCHKTVSGLSGSFSFVPNTWLALQTDAVVQENGWGEPTEYFPSIVRFNGDMVYVSANGGDASVCAYDTLLLSNSDHIIIEIN